MRAGTTYTHPGFLDVVMHVVKVTYRGPTYFKCKVFWLNKKGMLLNPTPDLVKVPLKDLRKWKVVL